MRTGSAIPVAIQKRARCNFQTSASDLVKLGVLEQSERVRFPVCAKPTRSKKTSLPFPHWRDGRGQLFAAESRCSTVIAENPVGRMTSTTILLMRLPDDANSNLCADPGSNSGNLISPPSIGRSSYP